jgi:hypothetical protein
MRWKNSIFPKGCVGTISCLFVSMTKLQLQTNCEFPDVEGEIELALEEGEEVVGFAVDSRNGRLIPAVPVEKQRARFRFFLSFSRNVEFVNQRSVRKRSEREELWTCACRNRFWKRFQNQSLSNSSEFTQDGEGAFLWWNPSDLFLQKRWIFLRRLKNTSICSL